MLQRHPSWHERTAARAGRDRVLLALRFAASPHQQPAPRRDRRRRMRHIEQLAELVGHGPVSPDQIGALGERALDRGAADTPHEHAQQPAIPLAERARAGGAAWASH